MAKIPKGGTKKMKCDSEGCGDEACYEFTYLETDDHLVLCKQCAKKRCLLAIEKPELIAVGELQNP